MKKIQQELESVNEEISEQLEALQHDFTLIKALEARFVQTATEAGIYNYIKDGRY